MIFVKSFFFISGFCALLYQTVWLRLIMASYGVNAPVISSVLSVFMMGLALGSYFGGKIARQFKQWLITQKLKPYAMLELFIAVGGMAVPRFVLFGRHALINLPMSNSGIYFFATFIAILITLLPFCIAMGATFPVALAYLENLSLIDQKSQFSHLYLMNVIGSFLGVLLSAFILIESLGFEKTSWVAVNANLFIALFAFLLAINSHEKPFRLQPLKKEAGFSDDGQSMPKIILFALFILGMCSLALEVVWSRIYVPYVGTEVYSFASILAVYLAFTFFGTWFYRKFLYSKTQCQIWIFWFLLGPAAATALYSCHPDITWFSSGRLLLGVAPISFVTGILTPLIIDTNSKSSPRLVGTAYAVNLLGCIVGPMLTGFILIPLFGNYVTCFLIVLVLWLLSFLIVLRTENGKWGVRVQTIFYSCLSFVFCTVLFLLGGTFEMKFPKTYVLHDHTATVIATGTGMEKQLIVNGQSVTRLTTITKLMAHWPMVHLPNPPARGLTICLGMGATFRSMASWDIRTTVVELVPSVAKLFPYYFDDAKQILSKREKKADIVIDDGRRYLDRTDQMFDVIAVDPPPPVSAAASSLLYSTEFYQSVKKHLRKTGILQVWTPGGDSKDLVATIRSLLESFPYVRQFGSIEGWGFHFLASESPIPRLDAKELANRLPEKAKKDLMEWVDQSPEQLFGILLDSEVDVYKFYDHFPIAHKVPLTDDRPVNEYYRLRVLIAKINRLFW